MDSHSITTDTNNIQKSDVQRPTPTLQPTGLLASQFANIVARNVERASTSPMFNTPPAQPQSTAQVSTSTTQRPLPNIPSSFSSVSSSVKPPTVSSLPTFGAIPPATNTSKQPLLPSQLPQRREDKQIVHNQQYATPNIATATSLQMSDTVFQQYRHFIYTNTGIYFSDNKKYLLESKVQKRLIATKHSSFEEYLTYINSIGKSGQERTHFYEAITINETYFFRSEQQVEAMENIIIDELCAAKNSTGKFRIWSAASSSGEEAYTMSLLITERMKHRYPSVDFSVVGTDISSSVVDTAKRGVYREYAIRNVPETYMKKYFTKQNDMYHLSDTVKQVAQFGIANLFDAQELRQLGKFDVIFCCNVLIYFDQISKQQVVASLYDALNPGGYLFIGYSESLHGISNAFEVVHMPKVLAYRRQK